jgi:hypothetical protein
LKLPRWAPTASRCRGAAFFSFDAIGQTFGATAEEENSMAGSVKGRVNLEKKRAEYEKFRDSTTRGPSKGKITFRSVDNDRENE